MERDITWAQGRKGGEQATLLHEATVWGGDKPRMGTKGAGNEVDGVANVVVEACLGVPRAMEEVIPMGIDCLATGSHRACRGGEKREAMGPAERQDKREVAKAILADLPAGCKESKRDQTGSQAWEKWANAGGAKVEERV